MRKTVAQADLARKQADVASATLPEFLLFLQKKYGSAIRSWRFLFDLDESGKVSRQEFIVAARDTVGYRGDIMKLFKELDKDGNGMISLNELDEEG